MLQKSPELYCKWTVQVYKMGVFSYIDKFGYKCVSYGSILTTSLYNNITVLSLQFYFQYTCLLFPIAFTVCIFICFACLFGIWSNKNMIKRCDQYLFFWVANPTSHRHLLAYLKDIILENSINQSTECTQGLL